MTPWILPLGDRGLLVRFGDSLSETANSRAIAFAQQLAGGDLPEGVTEIVPSLVSVLLCYDPSRVGFERLAGEVRLALSAKPPNPRPARRHRVEITFDGEDLEAVSAEFIAVQNRDFASSAPSKPTENLFRNAVSAFINAHNAVPLRVLATGFAPGFVYCGFHPEALRIPRRPAIRPLVPAGTVLFAAGQTAIAATPIPTGWHVIGHTDFRNFDPSADPPTRLKAGDEIQFEARS